jgi:hypothetical protein
MSLDDLKAQAEARARVVQFLKVYFICLGLIALCWAYSCR